MAAARVSPEIRPFPASIAADGITTHTSVFSTLLKEDEEQDVRAVIDDRGSKFRWSLGDLAAIDTFREDATRFVRHYCKISKSSVSEIEIDDRARTTQQQNHELPHHKPTRARPGLCAAAEAAQ
mmetsp:Transcript_21570/g.66931  ORF Transcript_21570/g.66931 Transcript_21570/m.66931 type:complete len:124 (+) Transcript_21570:1696-2067(+)